MIEREHRIPWHPPDYSGVCEPGVHELVGGLQTRSSLAHLRIYKYPQDPREYGRVFERSSDILQKHLLPDLAWVLSVSARLYSGLSCPWREVKILSCYAY